MTQKAPAPHGSPDLALVLPTKGALRGFCQVYAVQNFLHPDVKALQVTGEGSSLSGWVPRLRTGQDGAHLSAGAHTWDQRGRARW